MGIFLKQYLHKKKHVQRLNRTNQEFLNKTLGIAVIVFVLWQFLLQRVEYLKIGELCILVKVDIDIEHSLTMSRICPVNPTLLAMLLNLSI